MKLAEVKSVSDKWKQERLKGCTCTGPLKREVNQKCPIHGVVQEAAVQLNLRAIVDELKKSPTIENADVEKKSVHVFTKKGDVVSFNEHGESLYAWVQGQKNDIDVGAIGSSAADILEFLKGLDKKWYREYDEHFND